MRILTPHHKMIIFTLGLLLLLLLLTLVATNSGAYPISWLTLLQHPSDSALWKIWFNIRLPRIVLAIVVGMALACSGVIMQGVFRNPLADPGLLGISSGAALCVALFILFPLQLPSVIGFYGTALAAFIGSMAISLLIYFIGRINRTASSQLLLIGIAISAISSAITGMLTYISNDQQLRQFTVWSMGSLGLAQWHIVLLSSVIILPTMFIAWRLAYRLNLLQLGDEQAHYLGIPVLRTQQQLLFLSALLVGSVVAVSGIIVFVGLVIPHLMRLYVGANHKWLLPTSALGGAILLLSADTLARTLAAPAEIPVGLLTSLIGGPYFLWLVIRQRNIG